MAKSVIKKGDRVRLKFMAVTRHLFYGLKRGMTGTVRYAGSGRYGGLIPTIEKVYTIYLDNPPKPLARERKRSIICFRDEIEKI